MNIRLDELRRKYRIVKSGEGNIDPLSLKSEIESYIRNLQTKNEKNKDLLAEAQDLLIDLIKIIEEGHCQPFKPKKL
ncbi:MAG: hypothetical protein QXM22_00690 [Candidatus Bathyarchaeia archaeon]